jgi:hypothetical protein
MRTCKNCGASFKPVNNQQLFCRTNNCKEKYFIKLRGEKRRAKRAGG